MGKAQAGRLVTTAAERLGVFRSMEHYLASAGRDVRHTHLGGRGAETAGAGRYVELKAQIPLEHMRAPETALMPGAYKPLPYGMLSKMAAAHQEIKAILARAGGRPLTLEEAAQVTRLVNPTLDRSMWSIPRYTNCMECTFSLDAILGGRAAVAGPTQLIDGDLAASILERRSLSSATELDEAGLRSTVQRELGSAAPGARGIVVRWGNPGHVFNAANLEGQVRYLDGQMNKMGAWLDQGENPTFDFFRTA